MLPDASQRDCVVAAVSFVHGSSKDSSQSCDESPRQKDKKQHSNTHNTQHQNTLEHCGDDRMKVASTSIAAAAAAAAASSSLFTYKLGKSLYIPLTSFCNTVTLPETRGPGFHLSTHVIEALTNVRYAEQYGSDVCLNIPSLHDICSDRAKSVLPPRTARQYKTDSIYNNKSELFQERVQKQTNPDFLHIIDDDGYFPSIPTLLQQVQSQLDADPLLESIVFGGEGEPTLRLPAITSLSHSIRSMTTPPNGHQIPIRVLTNGLLQLLPDFKDIYIPDILLQLKQSGVTHFTVTLPTASPSQYIQFMDPILPLHPMINEETTVHVLQHVCSFIQESIQVGIQVEVTGVDRPDVDKQRVEDLAYQWGVTTPFRWRSYHP